MNYITVKQLYEKLNKQRPGLIGINSVYNIVKRKDFPSVRIGNKFLVIEKIIRQKNKEYGIYRTPLCFSDFAWFRMIIIPPNLCCFS